MTEPVTVTCAGACTVTHVITLNVPLLSMDAADGARISGAILLVWAVAFGFRMLIRTLNSSDGATSPDEG